MSGILNREIVSEVEVINSGGNKTALVVYQPGFSGFPKDVSYAFADGLASSRWRVEITTASPQTPSDLSDYGLLVLAYPVYGGTPGTAIVNYVSQASNLNGVDTVIIACGGGDSGESVDILKQKVENANGTFYSMLALSNQDGSAMEKATQAANNIEP
jgi:hypothetical protein